MTNNKGITLIALVITIIVLLILAGVSIAMLTGQNGILTQANNAKSNTAKAEIAEKVNMAVQAAYAKKVADGSGVASAALTGTEVAEQYVKDNGENSASAEGNKLTITQNSATYTVTLTPITGGKSFQAVTTDNVQ